MMMHSWGVRWVWDIVAIVWISLCCLQIYQMLKSILVDYNPVARVFNSLFNFSTLLSRVADYLGSFVNTTDKELKNLLFLTGVSTLTVASLRWLYSTCKAWSWLYPHYVNASRLSADALAKKYGKCWVLITGFTEGIGRGFAELFAEYGFNLLLIGRNEQKCKIKFNELKRKYHKTEMHYIVSDLADKQQIAQLQGQLQQWKGLDIGIVVNNAGSVAGGPYLQIDPHHIVQDVNVDLLALFEINRILLPQMRTRKERSAIINIASCTGVFLSTRLGVYSSTKRTVDFYTKRLQLQNKDKIDVISIRPFGVTTKMMKMNKGPMMITPRECAFHSIADTLAGESTSFTHFKHKLSAIFFGKLSEPKCFALYEHLWAQARRKAE